MHLRSSLAAAAALLLGSGAAHALATDFDTFGPLAGATFGGSGIPSTQVAITNLPGGGQLGLTITQRCAGAICGSTPTNDGAGNFFVQPEAPFGGALAGWNFNWAALPGTNNYTYLLFYDLNPAAGTPLSAMGSLGPLTTGFLQGSQNLGFGFLAGSPSAPGVTPPPSPLIPFNPTAPGEYSFSLAAYNGLTFVDSVTINVTAVPEPSTYALMLAGLGVVGFVARRRQKASQAQDALAAA